MTTTGQHLEEKRTVVQKLGLRLQLHATLRRSKGQFKSPDSPGFDEPGGVELKPLPQPPRA